MRLRDAFQEVRELGLRRSLFRAGWELRMRLGLLERFEGDAPSFTASLPQGSEALVPSVSRAVAALPFGAPEDVAEAIRPRLRAEDVDLLIRRAQEAVQGRILCFGRWIGDFGRPIDWHRNPLNGMRWDPTAHWSRAMAREGEVGDIKLTWEVARFPHAYHLARAATIAPEMRANLGAAFSEQVSRFDEANPFARGVHWSSGQEIVFRIMAWLFGAHVFDRLEQDRARVAGALAENLPRSAFHIERNIGYARHAVYNNHLLSEALGLYLCSRILPRTRHSERWRATGLDTLDEQAERQVAPDGGYIQNSHNYHRVAMQVYLWAWVMRRAEGTAPSPEWRRAMERSLEFLVAHQNPADGRLPNFGANDGALPSPLTSCDFSDFRPTLQALSLATRGERIYEPGPWDEEAAWLLGPRALEAPLRAPSRRCVSFTESGYHVLRGRDPASFTTLRCGSLRERFAQIDMLHVDVWWRGLEIAVGPGSYSYNGEARWHEHFFRTGSHNTIELDGRDQMLHSRRFKCLHWTRAALQRYEEGAGWSACVGEHYGYERHAGGCVHLRGVLQVGDDLWIVVDRVTGRGEHRVRLQWLFGPHEWSHEDGRGLLLQTRAGPFSVQVVDQLARQLPTSVVSGVDDPPRGWASRYYGEKAPSPSLVAEMRGTPPLALVTILSGGRDATARVEDGRVLVESGSTIVGFRVGEGAFEDIRLGAHA